MSVVISDVAKKSKCSRKRLSPGDTILKINDNEINDVLDYRFFADDDNLKIDYLTRKGKLKSCRIRNSAGVDALGLGFETYLMDRKQHCKNACIFCFIDQMPPGMRQSLYFKDDDSRLSFLFGNYITLTNLSEHEVDRIIRMHISPLNASVHTMEPELRVRMMKNPHAGESLSYLKRFSDAGIGINAQLVLCPGINDGEHLEYSLKKLAELDSVISIAAVPVGLTKYREGLYPLKSFDKNGASAVIDLIDSFNAERLSNGQNKLAFPSDEFYQIAERSIPDYDYYMDFSQLDNGVGLYALTEHDFSDCLKDREITVVPRKFSVATGKAAFPLIRDLSEKFKTVHPETEISVHCIENRFFGELVTVAGLITGKDLTEQLQGKIPDDHILLIPSVMLKGPQEPVFLDDMTVKEAENKLGVKIIPVGSSGEDLFYAFTGKEI